MKKKIVIGFLLIVLCCNLTIFSYATSITDLQDQKNEASNQKDALEDRKEEVENQKSEALSKIEELSEQISESQDKLDELNSKVKGLEKSIEEKEEELKKAEEEQQEKEDTLEKRLIAQYKTGKVSYWDLLLNPGGFLDFFSNLHNIEKIAKIDSELIESIKQEKANIEAAKNELSEQKSQAKAAKAEAEKENVVLKNAKMLKNNEVEKLSDEEKELQAKIDEYQQEMDNLESEMKRIAAEAAKKSNSNNSVSYNGQFAWPCPNYARISSTFGGRSSPGGGVGSRNHKGVDLAASHGSSILAAESGTVIKVSNTCTHDYPKTVATKCSCGSGFGNYVMIDHGNGLVTVYGHCSAIYVSSGQTVSRGQQIAAVGTTGYSTGNHLHFGVLRNGDYVDPMPYLQ